MAIITFMSDFGHRDHYVAAVKAKMVSINPHVHVVDISHEIEQFNIAHASFVLKSVYNDFPSGTVHLIGVNSTTKGKEKLIAMKFNSHFFVGVDNGLFSLLSDNSDSYLAVELPKDELSEIFPEKTVLASAAVALAGGAPLISLGDRVEEVRQMLFRQLRITKTQIVGHVIHVDNYGNLVTNITRNIFENAREGRRYKLVFSREMLETISTSYNACDPGDIVALFNTSGYLEVALNSGNASELLGLDYDSMITVSFMGSEEGKELGQLY